MLSTVVAVAALVLVVLPGFVTARIAAGRRAGPTTLGDLELILRALGYSLTLHAALLAFGVTGGLVGDIDWAEEWREHTSALLAFVVVLFAAAVTLGIVLRSVFTRLEGTARDNPWAEIVFHALGGQDARDGFDYLFQQRFERLRRDSEEFLVVVRIESRGERDSGLRYGRFGNDSWVGLSPRPHDLYLEEMWHRVAGVLRPWEPKHGGWFAAATIKDVQVRDIPQGGDASPTFGMAGVPQSLDASESAAQ